MDDQRIGAVIRSLRRRKGWRQVDLAERAGISQPWVSAIERGHVASATVATLRRVAAALDARIDLVARWRGGDLDRLLNRRHSLLHEDVARTFARRWPSWTLAPEVSFSIYGERGIIDLLAWHPAARALLVIELKTELVDVNEVIGTLDRKRRLAAKIAAERGWRPAAVSQWLVLADDRTTRRRVEAHRTMLRAAYPADGRGMRAWLRDPKGYVSGTSFWASPADLQSSPRVRVRAPARRPV